MADELATLIRLAKLQLDEKRKQLAVLLAKEDEMKAMRAVVLQRLEAESKNSQNALEGGRSHGAFAKASFKKRDEIDAAIVELNKFIQSAREEVRQAFEEMKRYEIAQDQREQKARKEAQRRDTKQLDEVGSELNRRRQREE
jgi:hypothetical protein